MVNTVLVFSNKCLFSYSHAPVPLLMHLGHSFSTFESFFLCYACFLKYGNVLVQCIECHLWRHLAQTHNIPTQTVSSNSWADFQSTKSCNISWKIGLAPVPIQYYQFSCRDLFQKIPTVTG